VPSTVLGLMSGRVLMVAGMRMSLTGGLRTPGGPKKYDKKAAVAAAPGTTAFGPEHFYGMQHQFSCWHIT
jgi:hypothetical protein